MRLPANVAPTRFAIVWALSACLAPSAALASGYHPGLDEAFAKAEIVALGRVVDAWSPETKKPPSKARAAPALVSSAQAPAAESIQVEAFADTPDFAGRVYHLRVERVFKGTARKGQEIVFWDPSAFSTAGYAVIEKTRNLVFLVPRSPGELDSKRYAFRVPVRFLPIESLPDQGDLATGFAAWCRLLEIGVGRRPARELTRPFRAILEKETNPLLLSYVAEHWPDRLGARDRALFASVLQREKASGSHAASLALRRLLRDGQPLDEAAVQDLLRTAGPGMRGDLLPLVTVTNIGSCQDRLWDWIAEDGPDVDDLLVDTLTRLAPQFVLDRLRAQELPFWKTIPLLRRLGKNGSAVGRPDFAPEALALRPQTLFAAARWVRGDGFLAGFEMGSPERNPEWKAVFPLLASWLAGADTPARRQLVAMMRTFGVTVSRVGERYTADLSAPPAKPPLELRLRAPSTRCRADEPCALVIDEVAASETWLSFTGELSWTSYRVGAETRFWWLTDLEKPLRQESPPRSDFVLLRPGDVRTTPTTITLDRPGRYQVSAHKGYLRDGSTYGLDAWTGVVFAEPVEIEVVE